MCVNLSSTTYIELTLKREFFEISMPIETLNINVFNAYLEIDTVNDIV